jgi:CBS domain containing-hemolysin-like protein
MMTGLIGMMVAPLSSALSGSSTSVSALTTFTPLNPLLIQGLAASATLSVVFAMMKPIDLTIHNTTRIAIACALVILASYVVPLAMAHISLGI